MKAMSLIVVGFLALASIAFSMDTDAVIRTANSLDAGIAEAAVRQLREGRKIAALMVISRKAPILSTQLAAIDALGAIGGRGTAEDLATHLEFLNVAIVEGGTEQRVENQMIKDSLVKALVKLCVLPAPANVEVERVSAFLSDCRAKLSSMPE